MSYIRAEIILPQELLELIQEYAGGQYLYIPKKADNRKVWGENTDSKYKVRLRDAEIYSKYKNGTSASDLAEEYFLSLKSIQRIILKEKNIETIEVTQYI
jgi:Mor family transcriptional regulator